MVLEAGTLGEDEAWRWRKRWWWWTRRRTNEHNNEEERSEQKDDSQKDDRAAARMRTRRTAGRTWPRKTSTAETSIRSGSSIVTQCMPFLPLDCQNVLMLPSNSSCASSALDDANSFALGVCECII